MALAMAKAAKQEEAISHEEEETMSHTAKEDDSDWEIVHTAMARNGTEAMSHNAIGASLSVIQCNSLEEFEDVM